MFGALNAKKTYSKKPIVNHRSRRPSNDPPASPENKGEIHEDSFRAAAARALSTSSFDLDVSPERFRQDVKETRARLRKRRRGLLNRRSPTMQRWDLLIIVCLGITCIWTPFEVSLMPTKLDASFFFSQAVNLVFIVDTIFTFFTPIFEARSGLEITSHWSIAKAYLRTWFPVDFVACVPFEVTAFFLNASDARTTALLRPMKVLRLLRLLKLSRVAKASKILARWENHITLQSTTRSLIFWTLIMFLSWHWFTCSWCLLNSLTIGALRTPELEQAVLLAHHNNPASCPVCSGSFQECAEACLTECEIDLLVALRNEPKDYIVSQEAWVCRYVSSGTLHQDDLTLHPLQVYLVMLGLKGGEMHVATNAGERLVHFVCFFSFQIVLALFLAALCGAISMSDPFTKQYWAAMDQLEYFLKEVNAPMGFRLKARAYMRASKNLRKRRQFPAFVQELSYGLRTRASEMYALKTIRNVHILRCLEAAAQEQLSLRLGYEAFSPREIIPNYDRTLSIVVGGVAASSGRVVTEGMSWGEDSLLLSSAVLVAHNRVIALTYCERALLDRETIDEVLANFPKSRRAFQHEAMLLATARGIVLMTRLAEKSRGENRSGSSPTRQTTTGGKSGKVAQFLFTEDEHAKLHRKIQQYANTSRVPPPPRITACTPPPFADYESMKRRPSASRPASRMNGCAARPPSSLSGTATVPTETGWSSGMWSFGLQFGASTPEAEVTSSGSSGLSSPRQQQHHHVNGQSTSSASDIVPMLRQLQDGQQSMQRHLANIKYDVIQQGKELGELRKWVVGDVLSKLSA